MAKKTKIRSTAAVQGDMTSIAGEQTELRSRLADIEAEIAAQWNSDTSDLENEYGKITARLKASERRIEQLQAEHAEAETAEYVTLYQERHKVVRRHQQSKSAIKDEIEALENQLKVKQQAFESVEHDHRLAMSKRQQAEKWLKEHGFFNPGLGELLKEVK